MRQYRFRALVTLAPAAGQAPAQGLPSRASALSAHACCLLEPSCCREYFPAVISRDEELPRRPGGHAVVTIALADGEADALFAPGQRFTIWADGVVGHTIRAEGLVGYGVVCGRESPPLPCDDGGGIRGEAAGPARVHRLAAGAPAAGDHDQGPGCMTLPGRNLGMLTPARGASGP